MTNPMKRYKDMRGGVAVKIVVGIAILFVILIVASLIRAGGPVGTRETACSNSCMNNLKQLDDARRQWAEKNGVTDPDATLVATNLIPFLSRDYLPVCPSDMDVPYVIPPLGTELSCPRHGTVASPTPLEELMRIRSEEEARWAEKRKRQQETQ